MATTPSQSPLPQNRGGGVRWDIVVTIIGTLIATSLSINYQISEHRRFVEERFDRIEKTQYARTVTLETLDYRVSKMEETCWPPAR